MLPATYQALTVALLAIVPGFLATATWSRAKTWRGFSADLTMVLRAIAGSLAIQVIVSPFTIWWLYPVRHHLDAHPWRIAAWITMVALAAPVVGGRLLAALDDAVFPVRFSEAPLPTWQRLADAIWRPAAPPSLWDWFFTVQPPDGTFLVELADGTRRGGSFGEGGFALTSPEPHALYLPQEWTLDPDTGDPIVPVPNSGGILFPSDTAIRFVRVVNSPKEMTKG